MFIFSDNEQLKKEFKKIVIDEGLSMVEISKRLDILPQQLNNKFNNSRISFNDLKMFLNACGYDLQVDFIKKDWFFWLFIIC